MNIMKNKSINSLFIDLIIYTGVIYAFDDEI